LEYGEKTEKHGKKETHTVRHEIWQETHKNVKNKKYTCRIWNIVRNPKIMEKEKHTLYDTKYVKKHSKMWKMRNAHGTTWSMARKLKQHGK
jgi:hypothetical protein